MNKILKNDLVKCLILFVSLLILDQLFKKIFAGTEHGVMNPGFIFGSGAPLSAFIRVSLISSIFGLIFFLFILAVYWLPKRNIRVKVALSFLVGGIAGNVFSKVLYGAAYDFIPLNLGFVKVTFNLADIFQWVGVIILSYQVIVHKSLWYADNKRESILVNKREQYLFSLKLCAVSFCASLLLGIFSYSFVKALLTENQFRQVGEHMHVFLSTYLVLTFVFMVIVFIAGLLLSHRYIGPFVAFGNYVDSVLDGNTRSFKLRKADYFKDLAPLADKLLDRLKRD